ncbi:DUF1444 family protein [Desulfotomaculum sp. 1211_IL3151]|uniref:DUF1444 family protein n=1 Tax=Desulfotomaculum sp. 1211_IL3151 TaxID=3084055 RepID=UPI002FDA8AE7
MDRQTFRKIVSEFILDAVPKSLIYNLDNFSIRMKKGEYWIDLALENFYKGYCRQKVSLRQVYISEVLAPFIKDLLRGSGVNHLDVKENLDQVFPLIVGPQDAKGIATTPLTDNLYIAYILDQGMRIFFLDDPTIEALDLSLHQLMKLAMRNFFRDQAKPLQVFDKKRNLYGFNYGDSYDSSRLLSILYKPENHGIPPDRKVYVMVPNRDVMLLLYSKEECDLRQSIMIGRSSFLNNPYPVSGQLFQVRSGVIQKSSLF